MRRVQAVVHHAGPLRIGGVHTPLKTLWRALGHAGFLTMFSFTVESTQRNSESNSSSMKSADAVSPVKKNKVKDKVKKQLKKAKHTLYSKKKDDDKTEKDKKSK
ncbi:jg22697 [Pararge aegeria aegeria]|uniref:Jg22697 protein n=1 Tax=Pararge aegeria aegeria TaxID=348720 RepID=A0A8S4QDJ3_9NEOP|nr:jg22697 [Pararge aegeria aegeria]